MSIRSKLFSVLVLLSSILAAGQIVPGDLQAPPFNTNQLGFPIFTLKAAPVQTVTTQLVGVSGHATYSYWIVGHYSFGALSPVGPFTITNVPDSLSGSNYVQLLPVLPPGLLNFDVLRTALPVAPSGACNCAVASAQTGTVNDQSNALNSYTVNAFDLNTLGITITNEIIGAGASHLILRQNGVFVVDLSSGTSPGTGVTSVSPATGTGALSPLLDFGFANQATNPALSMALRNAAANTVFANCTGGPAAPSYCSILKAMLPNTVLFNDQANTMGAGSTLDASGQTGANAFKVPVKAAATATVNGAVNYDSTNNNYHAAVSGVDAIIPATASSPAKVAGNLSEWLVSGGSLFLGDSGIPTVAGHSYVFNDSGTVSHIDGIFNTDLCAKASSLGANAYGTIFVDVAQTLTCDPFSTQNTQRLHLHFGRQSTPYILSHAFHVCARCGLSGDGVGSDVTSITNFQAGPSFPASIWRPQAAPTLTALTAGQCAGGIFLPAGIYTVGIDYSNETGPTDESDLSTITMGVDGGTGLPNQCFRVTSPPAFGNALTYSTYVSAAGDGVGWESWENNKLIGTDTVVQTQSYGDGNPPSHYNLSGTVILAGTGRIINGSRVYSASAAEISIQLYNFTVDANGISPAGFGLGSNFRTAVAIVKGQEEAFAREIAFKNAGSDGVAQNVGFVAEGLWAGQASNNSPVDDIQMLSDNRLNTCGLTLTGPCNPTRAGILSDAVKSLRHLSGISVFAIDGVTPIGIQFQGPTSGAGVGQNIQGELLDFHCEGVHSVMNFCVEVNDMAVNMVHGNAANTSCGIACIHWNAGAFFSSITNFHTQNDQRALQNDVCGVTWAVGLNTDLDRYGIGADCNHVSGDAQGLPMVTYTGGFTAGGTINAGDLVKLQVGPNDKVIQCAITEVGGCLGFALNSASLGSDFVDVAIGGIPQGNGRPIVGPGQTCAQKDWVYRDPTTGVNVACSSTRPAIQTMGRATQSAAAGARLELNIDPQAPAGTKSCVYRFGSNNAAAALANLDLGPQASLCAFPNDATIVEVDVDADGGTMSLMPEREVGNVFTNLLSAPLATATGGVTGCANVGGTTSLNGSIACSATLTITSVNALNRLGTASGTGDAAHKRMTLYVYYVNNF